MASRDEMIHLEGGLRAAQDDLNDACAPGKGRHTYRVRFVGGDRDRSLELDLFESWWRLRTDQSHCDLGHRLQPDDRREDPRSLEDMII